MKYRKYTSRHIDKRSHKSFWIILFIIALGGLIWAYDSEYIPSINISKPFQLTCEKQLQEDIKRYEIKNPKKDLNIIEKKSFVNLEEVIKYVEVWDVDNTENTIKSLKNNFAVNFGRIDIFLFSESGQLCVLGICDELVTTSSLRFGYCIGEETTYPYVEDFFGGLI